MRGILKHRAVVLRNVETGIDGFGQALPPIWLEIQDPVPCAVWSRSSREMVSGERTALIDDIRVALPLAADVEINDRIERVTDRRGVEQHPGPLRIDGIERKHTHFLCTVTRVS